MKKIKEFVAGLAETTTLTKRELLFGSLTCIFGGMVLGMFCSPRVAELKDGHIYFHMHPNLRAAYSRKIEDPADASGDGYMAVLDLEDGEQADIGGFLIRREGNHIRTDRTAVFPSFEGVHLISETPEIRDGSRLEVLVDQNLIEVYINDGEYVISNVVYGIGNTIRQSSGKKITLYTMDE